MARAQANLSQATALAERYKPLVEANAISKQDYANAVAAQKQAEADVAAGKAAVQTAQINVGYANVTAPISGRIGRALVTEGALVGQGEATQLALIQQINPVYVNFTQSASEVLALRRALAQGRLKRAAGAEGAMVKVVLEDGTEYPNPGKLLFSDLTVDPTSGQITLRAEVPNANGTLLPGLYVRVRIEQAKAGNAVLLPQQAVTRSNQGDTVMVVGSDGKVAPRTIKVGGEQAGQWVVTDGLKAGEQVVVDKEGKVAPRNVKVGNEQNGQWVILSGLQAGEQVIVDGFQKLRPGAPVKAVPWSAAAAKPQSGGAPAAAPSASAAASASSASASARK
jgi:membrane fusion protein (multidrug efflux system)